MKVYSIVFAGLIIILGCSTEKKAKTISPSFFKLLSEVPDLELTLTTDLTKLAAEKEKEAYQDAVLSSTSFDFPLQNDTIEIRARGVTRREICEFPPIMINLKKPALRAAGLSTFDKIKLVTHCKDSSQFEQLVLKEYLNYRLYNAVTDSSFSVVRATVTYKDSKNSVPTVTREGFFIEPAEELAERLSGTLDEESGSLKNVQRDYYQKLVMFQYMIGNTDWNLGNRHNIRVIQTGKEPPLTIPYDFDYSGLVNAPYAKPHPMLPISKVTDRLMQWRGSSDADFTAYVAFYNRKKDTFLSLCRNTKGLDENSTERIISYIESFYSGIDTPEKISAAILKARR